MLDKGSEKLSEHVTFCSKGDENIFLSGRQAELETVSYLLDNLKVDKVGNYQVLMNYNLPLNDPGVSGTLENDLIVITKFGIFLLEVKSWRGQIKGYADKWIVDGGRCQRNNPLDALEHRARTLHGRFFREGGELQDLKGVNVIGIVVLTNARRYYQHLDNRDEHFITGLNPQLINGLSGKDLHRKGEQSRELIDGEINRIKNILFGRYEAKEKEIIRDYRILGELSHGDLFYDFEAQHTSIETRRVRIKRYELQTFKNAEREIKQFQRNAEVMSRLGSHPNLLNTLDFFQESETVFYEITELPPKTRLDELMAEYAKERKAVPFQRQIELLEGICLGLDHAHKYKSVSEQIDGIFHRNLKPETVFVDENGKVKVADFDFGKLFGAGTSKTVYSVMNKPFDSSYNAPEIAINASLFATRASDVYSLGILWFKIASLAMSKELSPSQENVELLDLPPDAKGLLKKMIDQVIALRPQNMKEILDGLQRYK